MIARLVVAGLAFCLLLAACAQTKVTPVAGPAVVGTVALVSAAEEPSPSEQLNIGIHVFETEASAEAMSQLGAAIFAQIRTTETQYLPTVLRDALIASNQWGVIRVLPQNDPSVDLQITGTILESDGLNLTLHIRAVDSSGVEWLNKAYADEAQLHDYPEFVPSLRNPPPTDSTPDPFHDIYAQIANDLLTFKDTLSDAEIATLRRVSQIVYARDLSPDAFGGYLQNDATGKRVVVRLPAANDPILGYVAEIRARHYVFIDTIDEYYEALHQDLKPIYDIWRQYSYEQVVEERSNQERIEDGGYRSGSGSFESLSQNYNRYKWAKIFEQEFVALASGFVAETAPAVLELSRNVNGLTGPVEEQYAQWRDLLRQMFELEAGADATR